MLGICNGFQVLCEARPAARARCSPTPAGASSAARSRSSSSSARHRRSRPPCRTGSAPGDLAQIPVKHATGRYYAAGDARRAARRRAGRPALRARAELRTARCATSPACVNEAGNVFGLMPHPEHAVDPLTGSTDGLVPLRLAALAAGRDRGRRACLTPRQAPPPRRRGAAHSLRRTPPDAPDRHRRPRARADARRVRADRQQRGRAPTEVELAMFSLLWSEHCAYKHSKRAAAHAADRGPARRARPRRERRRGRRRRRPRVRLQGRVPQPPERRRALPGRRDRRRRDPARHLRDRRAADRRARLAALRRAHRRALALPARPRRRRDRPLRQLDRRADDRRRGLLRGPLRAELPHQRDVRRALRARAADPLGRRRPRQPARPVRRLDRPRRDRRRLGARLRRARRRRRRQAPERPDRRPLRRRRS